jgi:3-oxoadipate enol-lactonase/4-carboxymuconolactone decarboxylase
MRYDRSVPIVVLAESPLAPGAPARVHVREAGAGAPLALLHGGWGWEAYPWDVAALAARHRVVAPDRTGYGGSGRLAALPDGFHRRMAEETLLVLDALGIGRTALWGHSDGAVVAAWAALLAPERVSALVLEAFHVFPGKPSSLEFFTNAVESPEAFGPAVVEALRRDHGPSWREVVGAGGRAWLRLIAEGRAGRPDLFDGRLGEIVAPALVVHGRNDPRMEPGEIEAGARAIPGARLLVLEAGHCPHASARAGPECTRAVLEFLAAVPAQRDEAGAGAGPGRGGRG